MAVDGNYDIVVNTPMGKMSSKLTLKSEAGALSGTMQSQLGTNGFSGGTVNGDEFAWSMEINSPMGKMKLDCSGKVDGDAISGEVKVGAFGTSPFSGTRI